jgi:hypothetical protein
MDKNRKMMLGIGGLALVCALCACVLGIGSYIYQDELMAWLGLAPSQKVAGMLPADTQFYMATNPNLQSLPGYQNLETLYLDNPEIQALFDEFEAEAAEETNITFEADIKPWLGNEIGLAMLDLGGAIGAEQTPSFMLAAQTTNAEASSRFIDKVLAEAVEDEQPFTDEVYQEVTLHRQENQFDGEALLLTTVDEFVVVSNSDTVVKEMIDRSQGSSSEPALVDSDRFQKVAGELPPEAVLTMYVGLAGLFDEVLANSPVEFPPEQTQDLEAFEAMGMAGTLQADGIQFDIVMTYDVEKMTEQTKASLRQPASPNQILNDVPAEAIFVYNINNLNHIWQQTRQGLEANPDFGETLQDFEQELGLSIDEDIFSWMTGEFALVLLEVPPADEFAPPVGGYALIGTDNVDNARSRVENVMSVLIEQEAVPFPPETRTIGGIEMNVFTDFDGAVQGGYGFYNDYFLLAYPEAAIMAATSAAQNPLANSGNFIAVQNHLPEVNYGYMYVDLERGRGLLENQLSDFEREEYHKNVRPFLEPIRALGISASTEGVEKGLTKGVLFMLMTQ